MRIPTIRMPGFVRVVAVGSVTTVTCLALGVPAQASTAGSIAAPIAGPIDWGPVVTVADQGFDNLSTLTTDNGNVIAVWSGGSFRNVYVSVRKAGDTWPAPSKIVTSAAAVTMSKDGKGAWVLWQGFDDVSVVHIGADGSLGTPEVIGSSSDPFISDARISAGSGGAAAAAWHAKSGSPAKIAYRPAGGDWTTQEAVPRAGSIAGLVVGARGTAQLLLRRNNPDFRHQEIDYLRRSPAGAWSSPFVVASKAYITTVQGNRHGDLVVGWETVNEDGTITLVARYKAAESGFGAAQHLNETVPENTVVALAIADDGSLVSAYRTTTQGSQQIQMTPADSTGLWLDPQTLDLTGSIYDVAMNAAGDSVVTSQQASGVQLVRCPASGTCGSTETNPEPRFRFPSMSLGRNGTITLLWGRGCRTEECFPTRLVAQRGR